MSYVLIVDDDKTMAQAIADMVDLLDWPTQTVHSPRAALEAVQRKTPALILLDLNMPGVTGIEVLGFIKRDPLARDIPVVFVTAEDDPGTQQRVRDAGALDYLIKPLEFDKLEEVLESISKPQK